MKAIWKFGLDIIDVQTVSMPEGAKILSVQAQNGMPYLWAEVDVEATPKDRTIEIFGTGHPMRCDMGVSREYIETFQIRGGQLVFHVYEYTGV